MRDRATRRAVLGGVAAAIATVSGCLGDTDPATATATTTKTSTPPPTGTPTTDCPPTLTVYELGAEPVDTDEAVAYEDLTADQQATFDRARAERVEDFDDAWYDIPVVVYRGEHYRASIEVC